MAIPRDERLMTLAEAAATLPRRRAGRPTHASTLVRWSRDGLRGVHLEVIQVGSTKCTTQGALGRFFEALTRRSGDRRGGTDVGTTGRAPLRTGDNTVAPKARG
jgi:hypothetical protein